MTMMDSKDLKTIIAGAIAWTIAIPAVKIAGQAITTVSTATTPIKKDEDSSSTVKDKTDLKKNLLVKKTAAVILGFGIAALTSKLLPQIMDWKTQYEKVRGIALALGTAQTIDGLVHIFYPAFYATSPSVSLGCAANIFLGAGLLGLFSAY
jgi:ethanolamine transporter EutH